MLENKGQHLTWGGPKRDFEANSMALVCTELHLFSDFSYHDYIYVRPCFLNNF